MSRIAARFDELRGQGQKALIPYVVAGDPSPEDSERVLQTLAEEGADLIAVGLPFSDPIADGTANQSAMQRALAGGMTTLGTLELTARLRHQSPVPLVLMTYINPLLRVGLRRWAEMASDQGVDAILPVDLPLEESEELDAAAYESKLDLIRLHSPTTPDDRSRELIARSSGFLYVVARLGVTGTDESALDGDLPDRARFLASPEVNPRGLPLVVGFGIARHEQLAPLYELADGAAVGSAFSRAIGESVERGDDPAEAVRAAMRMLRGSDSE